MAHLTGCEMLWSWGRVCMVSAHSTPVLPLHPHGPSYRLWDALVPGVCLFQTLGIWSQMFTWGPRWWGRYWTHPFSVSFIPEFPKPYLSFQNMWSIPPFNVILPDSSPHPPHLNIVGDLTAPWLAPCLHFVPSFSLFTATRFSLQLLPWQGTPLASQVWPDLFCVTRGAVLSWWCCSHPCPCTAATCSALFSSAPLTISALASTYPHQKSLLSSLLLHLLCILLVSPQHLPPWCHLVLLHSKPHCIQTGRDFTEPWVLLLSRDLERGSNLPVMHTRLFQDQASPSWSSTRCPPTDGDEVFSPTARWDVVIDSHRDAGEVNNNVYGGFLIHCLFHEISTLL